MSLEFNFVVVLCGAEKNLRITNYELTVFQYSFFHSLFPLSSCLFNLKVWYSSIYVQKIILVYSFTWEFWKHYKQVDRKQYKIIWSLVKMSLFFVNSEDYSGVIQGGHSGDGYSGGGCSSGPFRRGSFTRGHSGEWHSRGIIQEGRHSKGPFRKSYLEYDLLSLHNRSYSGGLQVGVIQRGHSSFAVDLKCLSASCTKTIFFEARSNDYRAGLHFYQLYVSASRRLQ